MKDHQYCVYIIGVTSNLEERIWQHKQKVYQGFAARYDCNKLVYYEEFQWIQDAIAREKTLKGGSRQKKINLIVNSNPAWNDLSASWYE